MGKIPRAVLVVQRRSAIDIQMPVFHFLLTTAEPPSNNLPAGFVLLEDFTCPNCGRVVQIASTGQSPDWAENISTARNAVTALCPDHDTPTSVPCQF